VVAGVDYRNIVAKIGNLYHNILSQERKKEEKNVG